MSLGIVISCQEGIVFASDSRLSLVFNKDDKNIISHFDHAKKIFSLSYPHEKIGILTVGAGSFKDRTAYSFISDIEKRLGERRLESVAEYAEFIASFYKEKYDELMGDTNTSNTARPMEMIFYVCGYDTEHYGKIYSFTIPSNTKPILVNGNNKRYSISMSGDSLITSRIITGIDQVSMGIIAKKINSSENVQGVYNEIVNFSSLKIPFEMLSIDDCLLLAKTLIKTTINLKKVSIGEQNVGGKIVLGVISRVEPFYYVDESEIID
ncbi:MAG: hypothetical protein LBV51_03260 [Acholeplasmatales bacterium]|jgi:hypothetical protein|nr:hypothetical protein [Acholeplasmatales bacterium]